METRLYDAVIFDLFGTLVPRFSQSRHDAVMAKVADVLNVPPEPFVQAWVAAYEHRGTGRETIEAQIRKISRELGASAVSGEALERVNGLRVKLFRESLTPRPEAVHVLTKLRESGLKLGLTSDCSSEAPLLWPTTPLAPLFDAVVFSCEVGCCKPDPRIYRAACDQLGVDTAACLYVGDGMSQELTGASSLGMDAVLLSVPGESDSAAEIEAWQGPTISSLEEVLALTSRSSIARS